MNWHRRTIAEEYYSRYLAGRKAERVPGWKPGVVDGARVAWPEPALERTVVGVVPGMSGHSTGIVVAGRAADGDFYVLGDHSMAGGPDYCTKHAVAVYRHYDADLIAGMVNDVGWYLEKLLRTVDDGVRFKAVHATRGASERFKPVGALYEQVRVHHVGTLTGLEARMAAWTTQTTGTESQVNALVCAITELKREDA